MRNFFLAGITLFACLGASSATAQYAPSKSVQPEKALLFTKLPAKFSVNSSLMNKVFAASPQDRIVIPVTGGESFDGIVLENARKNDHVITVNIRASNYAGALLTLSKITYDDRSVKYIGRIVNFKYGDAFVLKKEDEEYSFVKEKQSRIVTE